MERILHYVWLHRLLTPGPLATVSGEPLRIIDPGQLNTNSGPDFFNAKIDIGGHIWAGDVEIHVKASDWHRHGHDGDPAYDSVILHVVDTDDSAVTRSDGQTIPQLILPFDHEIIRRYNYLLESDLTHLPCAAEIASTPPLHLRSWLDALAFERLYDKADHILDKLTLHKGDWETVAYITLARALGTGINGEAMERLAESLPPAIIGKHSDSVFAVEAMMFGQSGLLDMKSDLLCDYAHRLITEYRYLSHKFNLHTPPGMRWKMSRMRPAAFPHRRIAMLAALMSSGVKLYSAIIETRTVAQARSLFSPQLSDFWQSHFNFTDSGKSRTSTLGKSTLNSLIINVVAPLIVAHAHVHGSEQLIEQAVELLQQLPAESNTLVRRLERAGIKIDDSFHSQGAIQLIRRYCEPRECLRCRFGASTLRSGA